MQSAAACPRVFILPIDRNCRSTKNVQTKLRGIWNARCCGSHHNSYQPLAEAPTEHRQPTPVNLAVPMSDRLAVSEEEIRAICASATELVASYYGGLADRPVLTPTTSGEIRKAIQEPLPRDGTSFEIVARHAARRGLPLQPP